MTKILIVCGSRSLFGNIANYEWALELIKREIFLFKPDLIVTGDAQGPDTWTDEAFDGPVYHYTKHGTVVCQGKVISRWAKEEDAPGPEANRAIWKAWLLHRDRVMVQNVAKRVAESTSEKVYEASLLALVDPKSDTHGTEFTASRAEALKIPIKKVPR